MEGRAGGLFLWLRFEPLLEWRNHRLSIMCCKMPDFFFIIKKQKWFRKNQGPWMLDSLVTATDFCRTKLHILAHSTNFAKSEPEPFLTCHEPTWEHICYPTTAIFPEHTFFLK